MSDKFIEMVEKAAEEEAGCCELMPLFVFDELSGNTDRVQAMARKIAVEFFLRGAAWAAPKWVHVNDKWPEPEKMVLVYIPDAAEWQRIRTTLRVKPEGKHNGLVAQWAGAAIGVTHWCELPAAPEVEK